jgi:hypothetical protein
VTWASTLKGTLTSYLEVVGGFLFSLADLARSAPQRRPSSTAAQLAGEADQPSRAAIELELRLRSRSALHARAAPARRRHGRHAAAELRAVRSISTTSAGVTTPYSAAQLSALKLESWGVCGVWVRGPVTIGYEHGEDFPDSDIAEAALLLADEAYGSAVDGRVVRQEADNMAVTYASPSSSGPFIGARLNQIIRANRMPGVA